MLGHPPPTLVPPPPPLRSLVHWDVPLSTVDGPSAHHHHHARTPPTMVLVVDAPQLARAGALEATRAVIRALLVHAHAHTHSALLLGTHLLPGPIPVELPPLAPLSAAALDAVDAEIALRTRQCAASGRTAALMTSLPTLAAHLASLATLADSSRAPSLLHQYSPQLASVRPGSNGSLSSAVPVSPARSARDRLRSAALSATTAKLPVRTHLVVISAFPATLADAAAFVVPPRRSGSDATSSAIALPDWPAVTHAVTSALLGDGYRNGNLPTGPWPAIVGNYAAVTWLDIGQPDSPQLTANDVGCNGARLTAAHNLAALLGGTYLPVEGTDWLATLFGGHASERRRVLPRSLAPARIVAGARQGSASTAPSSTAQLSWEGELVAIAAGSAPNSVLLEGGAWTTRRVMSFDGAAAALLLHTNASEGLDQSPAWVALSGTPSSIRETVQQGRPVLISNEGASLHAIVERVSHGWATILPVSVATADHMLGASTNKKKVAPGGVFHIQSLFHQIEAADSATGAPAAAQPATPRSLSHLQHQHHQPQQLPTTKASTDPTTDEMHNSVAPLPMSISPSSAAADLRREYLMIVYGLPQSLAPNLAEWTPARFAARLHTFTASMCNARTHISQSPATWLAAVTGTQCASGRMTARRAMARDLLSASPATDADPVSASTTTTAANVKRTLSRTQSWTRPVMGSAASRRSGGGLTRTGSMGSLPVMDSSASLSSSSRTTATLPADEAVAAKEGYAAGAAHAASLTPALYAAACHVRDCMVQVAIHLELIAARALALPATADPDARQLLEGEAAAFVRKLQLECSNAGSAVAWVEPPALVAVGESDGGSSAPVAVANAAEPEMRLRLFVERIVVFFYHDTFPELVADLYREVGGNLQSYVASTPNPFSPKLERMGSMQLGAPPPPIQFNLSARMSSSQHSFGLRQNQRLDRMRRREMLFAPPPLPPMHSRAPPPPPPPPPLSVTRTSNVSATPPRKRTQADMRRAERIRGHHYERSSSDDDERGGANLLTVVTTVPGAVEPMDVDSPSAKRPALARSVSFSAMGVDGGVGVPLFSATSSTTSMMREEPLLLGGTPPSSAPNSAPSSPVAIDAVRKRRIATELAFGTRLRGLSSTHSPASFPTLSRTRSAPVVVDMGSMTTMVDASSPFMAPAAKSAALPTAAPMAAAVETAAVPSKISRRMPSRISHLMQRFSSSTSSSTLPVPTVAVAKPAAPPPMIPSTPTRRRDPTTAASMPPATPLDRIKESRSDCPPGSARSVRRSAAKHAGGVAALQALFTPFKDLGELLAEEPE